MRPKLTLSIDKETIKKAKELAKKQDTTVSRMFTDFIEQKMLIEKKLKALEKVSGAIETDIEAEPDEEYTKGLNNKHGW